MEEARRNVAPEQPAEANLRRGRLEEVTAADHEIDLLPTVVDAFLCGHASV